MYNTGYCGTDPDQMLAALDVLSKGRMRLLTAGVGALPGEAMAGGSISPAAARPPAGRWPPGPVAAAG